MNPAAGGGSSDDDSDAVAVAVANSGGVPPTTGEGGDEGTTGGFCARNRFLRRARIVLFLSLCIGVMALTFSQPTKFAKVCLAFLDWLDTLSGSALLSFAYLGFYIGLGSIGFPVSPLTVGGGYVFARAYGVSMGIFLSSALTWVGANMAASIAFLMARAVLRPSWQRRIQSGSLNSKVARVFRALDSVLKAKADCDDQAEEDTSTTTCTARCRKMPIGLRLAMLVRMNPMAPFNLCNWGFGASLLAWKHFAIATAVGAAPWCILIPTIGASLGELDENTISNLSPSSHPEMLFLFVAAIIATIVCFVMAVRYVKAAVETQLETVCSRVELETQLVESKGGHSEEL